VPGRKEVCIGLEDSLVAGRVKLPCAMYTLVEIRVSLTVEESVCLSRGEGYDLPQRFREEVNSCSGCSWRLQLSVVIKPLPNSL